jgi:hypothetical protein
MRQAKLSSCMQHRRDELFPSIPVSALTKFYSAFTKTMFITRWRSIFVTMNCPFQPRADATSRAVRRHLDAIAPPAT